MQREHQRNRVVVTGLGVLSCGGIGKDEYWESLSQGKSGIGEITRFDTAKHKVRIGGEIAEERARSHLDEEIRDQLDRVSCFGAVATKLALIDSGIHRDQLGEGRGGLCLGSSAGGLVAGTYATLKELYRIKGNGGNGGNGRRGRNGNGSRRPGAHHRKDLSLFPGNFSQAVVEALGINIRVLSIATGCTGSSDAIGYGYESIQQGLADVMVVGGSESPVEEFTVQAFDVIKVLSRRNESPQQASRPFDLERDGFVIAEGAGVLVLEELEHARARNARIYAEIAGYETTCDAYHLTSSDPRMEASTRAMRAAMAQAGVDKHEVDHISAHGSSTPMNDKRETEIIKAVFDEHAYAIPITGIKSMIGHTSGAAGAVQAVACALTMEHHLLPPTINYEFPDPECDLDYIPNRARPSQLNTILQSTYAYSGKNVAIVFKRVAG